MRTLLLRSRSSIRALGFTVLVTGCGTAMPANDAAAPFDGDLDASLGSPAIVLHGGGSLVAVAGDVLHLDVVMVTPTGEQSALPVGATVEWNAPTRLIALASGSTPTTSQLPATGTMPVGFFLQNREHYSDVQLEGVLILTDSGSIPGGTIAVDAHVSGAGIDANVTAHIPVGPVPSGDAAHGQTYYANNCASCHGARGEGAVGPGLNHAGGNVASAPSWNSAIFASVPRADLDELGVSEGPGMPLWLTTPAADGTFLQTQDMVDVYAWLLTQE